MNNGFTWHERLADWLTGGDYSTQRERAADWRECAESHLRLIDTIADHDTKARSTLRAIHAATKDGKSGTARKVARIAKEALK